MLTLAISARDRTCKSCGRTIPKHTTHIEARGGPATNWEGIRNSWVHFHHIRCTKSTCATTEVNAYQRRYERQRRTRTISQTRPRRQQAQKRPWRV